jgi:hypothetical protein
MFKPAIARPVPPKNALREDVEYDRGVAAKKAEVLEKPYQEEVAALAYLNRPVSFNQAVGDTQSALDLIRQYPAVARQVFDMLRQAGPLAAAGAAGLGFSFGGYGAQMKIPVEAYLSAGISDTPMGPDMPSPRDIADKLAQNLASSAFYGLVARGIDPSAAGVEKMSLSMKQEPLMKNTAKAAFSALKNNLNSFRMAKELHDLYKSEQSNVDPNSLTPLHDIATQSNALKVMRAKHAALTKAGQVEFAGLKPGVKP